MTLGRAWSLRECIALTVQLYMCAPPWQAQALGSLKEPAKCKRETQQMLQHQLQCQLVRCMKVYNMSRMA